MRREKSVAALFLRVSNSESFVVATTRGLSSSSEDVSRTAMVERLMESHVTSYRKDRLQRVPPVVAIPKALQHAVSALQKEKTSHPKRLRQLGKKVVESIKMRSLSRHRGGIQPNLFDGRASPTVLRGARRQQEKQALKALTLGEFPSEEVVDEEVVSQMLTSRPEYQVLKASAEQSVYKRQLEQLSGLKLYNGLGALAYASARLPSTYAAIKHVLQRLVMSREGAGEWVPESMLDFGAGPGTAAWAARHIWPSSNIRVTAIENSHSMANLGYEILDMCADGREARYTDDGVVAGDTAQERVAMDVRWRPYFPRSKGALSKHDICIAAYSLNELNDSVERHHVLNKLIQSSQQYIVLIEPGTPHGFSIIEDSRTYVLKVSRKLGMPFHVVAPCPHDGACPLRGTKSWCHFSQRHTRTEEQRIAVKSLTGKAPRDTFAEKFSYVILRRGFREGGLGLLDAPHATDSIAGETGGDSRDQDIIQSNSSNSLQQGGGVDTLKSLSDILQMKIPHSRILRTRKRKGHVLLDLCTVLDQDGAHLGDKNGTILRQTVSRAKSNKSWDKGSAYRASRTLQQGDQWPLLYQAGSNTIEAPVLQKEYLFPEGAESDTEDEELLLHEGWFIEDDDTDTDDDDEEL